METMTSNEAQQKRGGQWISRKGVLQTLAVSISLLGLAIALAAAQPRAASAETQSPESAEPRQEISTADVRTGESDAGNLVADAVRSAAAADVAFVPAAAFKPGASIPRPTTAEQAAALVEPSSDIIVVLNLKGDQILAALERSVSFAPQPSAGFLQVSGLSFSFDAKKESQKRVSAVAIGGRPLDRNATYKVATTRPLGNGQQGYHQVWGRNAIASDTGKSLSAALGEYESKQGGALSSKTDGRIKSL